jgi:hypothetical protein
MNRNDEKAEQGKVQKRMKCVVSFLPSASLRLVFLSYGFILIEMLVVCMRGICCRNTAKNMLVAINTTDKYKRFLIQKEISNDIRKRIFIYIDYLCAGYVQLQLQK